MAKKALREFIFTGTIKFGGVQFFVTALDEAEAMGKAARGDFVEYDTAGAETLNWEINPNTIQSNG